MGTVTGRCSVSHLVGGLLSNCFPSPFSILSLGPTSLVLLCSSPLDILCLKAMFQRAVVDLRTSLSLFQKPLSIIYLGRMDLSCSRANIHSTSLWSWLQIQPSFHSVPDIRQNTCFCFWQGKPATVKILQTFMLSLDWSLHHVVFLPCLSH